MPTSKPTTPVVEIIARGRDDLALVIQRRREVITVTRDDSRVARAIAWLLDVQQPGGGWGNENVATTATVTLALAELARPASEWDLTSRVRDSFARATEFLVGRHGHDQFELALWDTAMVVRSLCAMDALGHDLVADRVLWLSSTDIQTLHVGPHHLAQRTLALAAAGASAADVNVAATAMREALEDGLESRSPYVLGQCMEASRVARDEAGVDRLTPQLLRYLSSVSLDSANFINICSAVRGLLPSQTSRIAEGVRTGIASLFGETCFRADGTWYHDPSCTAWALLALTPFSREIVIRAPKAELLYEVTHTLTDMYERAESAARSEQRSSAVAAISLATGSAIAAAYIVGTSLANLPTWIDWAAPIVFVAAFAYGLNYFRRRVR